MDKNTTYQTGNTAATKFESLVNRLYVSLCFAANRFLCDKTAAQDIVQEAFARLWELQGKNKNIENVFEIINKNIPKSIDIKCSVCYDKTVAGACAQAFSTSEELPESDLPRGKGTVTDFAHRAIHTAQATSESYGRKAAWTIHKMLEMIWNISFAVLRFLAVFRPFYILQAEVKLNETKKEERNQPIRYALSLLW